MEAFAVISQCGEHKHDVIVWTPFKILPKTELVLHIQGGLGFVLHEQSMPHCTALSEADGSYNNSWIYSPRPTV